MAWYGMVISGISAQTFCARVLSCVRQPAGGKFNQSGSADWLLRKLQLRRAYERMSRKPNGIILIIGLVREDRTRRRGGGDEE